MGIADPHRHLKCIRESHGTTSAGKKDKLSTFLQCKGHGSCFDGIFDMTPETSSYDATLFRFPLRQPDSESRITKNCYKPEKVRENLFHSLKVEAPILLLFLKSIFKVAIYEWDESCNKPVCKFSVQISKGMKKTRQNCYKLATSYNSGCGQATAILSSATTECSEGEQRPTQYHWLIVNSIGSDTEELRELAEQMKVLPWVGIAMPSPIDFSLQGQEIEIDHISETQGIKTAFLSLSQQLQQLAKHICAAESEGGVYSSGQAFCFLPLPGSIALPVNLHGYFAVADNRRSIKWPSHDERGQEAQWNEMLLHKLISPLYTLLLACRSSLIHYRGTSAGKYPNDAYAAWPVHAEIKNKHIWSEILEPMLTQIIDLPVLWTEACGGMWVKPTEAHFIHPENACPEVAVKILVACGCNVVCLPSEIQATMISSDKMEQVISTRYVTAELVQNVLREKGSLPDFISPYQVYELLDYVLTHMPSATVLEGIQLIPLNDHVTCCQFASYNGHNAVYIFPEKYKDALEFLPGISSVVIDTNVPIQLQTKLEDIALKKALQIRVATPDIICGLLLKQSMESWYSTQEQPCIWQPSKAIHPPVEWIGKIWWWIRTNKVSLSKLSHVSIVPQEQVHSDIKQVHLLPLDTSPGLCTLPDRLPHQCPPEVMLKLITAMGFIHVQKSECVFQCPGIEQYIHRCDARFLVNHLMRTKNVSSFAMKLSNEEKDALCHLIAHDFGEDISDKQSACIKSLPIFKAGVGGTPTQYVSLRTPHYVLPPRGITFQESIEYPPQILNDENSHEISFLLSVLKIKRFNIIEEFCETVVLPSATQSDDLVMWVLQLPLTSHKFLQRFSIIQPCVDSTMRKRPTELFDPEDDILAPFFDPTSDNVFPDAKYKTLLPILRAAGMKTWHSLRSNSEELHLFLIDRAQSVSQLDKTKGFLRSKHTLQYLLSLKLLQNAELSKIKFLFQEESLPSDYPSQLTWCGSSGSQEVSPQDVCCRVSDAYLVGSVLPLLSSQYGIHGVHAGFHEISVHDVVSHFRNVVALTLAGKASTQSDVEKVNNTVMKIYNLLSPARLYSELNLPSKWIWWKNSKTFLAPEDCIVQLPLEIVSLEPFVFSLSTNTEICSHVLSMHPGGFQRNLSTSKAIEVLEKMSQERNVLSPQELRMAISILEWLKNQGHHTHGDVLIPTEHGTLVKASECTFDDRNWTKTKVGLPRISRCTFVHDSIPPALAKHFCVIPLSCRVAPSQKVKLKYTKAGQHEPITRRIRKLVEDYATSSDIFKELLQNADDAGATEVKFLIDWRQHPTSSLLADELQAWQGPALLAYNNSVFSDQDFQHICELAAETKMKDPYKTGRFGVGFCATYHITDLPSFISRHYFTVFDPHTTYLGERVSAAEPGMRINLIENQEDLNVYADQFQPYNGMFGCDIFALPEQGFQGTLFRFPFRCSDTARKSKICQEVINRRCVENLLHCFREEAPHLLLFLKSVTKVSLSVLEEKATSPSEMVTIVDVQKTCEREVRDRMALIDAHVKGLSREDTSICHCTIKTRLFNSPRSSKCSITTSKWVISSAVDLKSPSNDSNKKHGLVPFAEIAIQIEELQHCSLFPKAISGRAFCFLPLPQKTRLPFHVSGFFDVSQDRSGLKSTDDGRFGKQWNECLCKGALTHAFIMGVSHIAAELSINKIPDEEKKTYLDTYYKILDVAQGKGLIGETLSASVKKDLPESKCELIWSDVSGGKWLLPKDVVLLELEHRAQHMLSTTAQVLLFFQQNICNIPNHVKKLIIDFLKSTSKQVYTYHTFCTDILMPNLRSIPCELRDEHIYFLLKNLNGFKWIDEMMRKWPCIPVQCSKDLKLPKDVIDNRVEWLRNLYEAEEGYFPAEILQELPIMNSLQQLGMIRVLSIEDIMKRAQGVLLIAQQKGKAEERAWRILQYIQQHYLVRTYHHVTMQKDGREKLKNALKMIPFLPTVQKPSHIQVPWCESDTKFACPQDVCVPRCNNLVFNQQPIVELPDNFYLSPDVLLVIGASPRPPLSTVISHLLCVSSSAGCFDEATQHFITDAMKTVYKYLQRTLCSFKKDETLEAAIIEAKTCLAKKNFIWQNGHFLEVNQVFVHWKSDCYPYICELSSQNKEYVDLFSLLGVKVEPSVDVLATLLCRIAGDYPPQKKVPDNILTFVEAIVQIMFLKLTTRKDDHVPSNLFLPDEHCVMRSVQKLACDNYAACDKVSNTWIQSLETFKSQFSGGEFYFVHGSIPRERAIKLGVRPLLDALLRGIEVENFLCGTDFGQHENLCDRLESILRKYPTNCSILNEFIQNADDAQASEVVFVLDRRIFPKEKLFSHDENWKSLQETPALCILNNRKFKEEDIQGITKLGRGNKRDSPEMIGKFGIGFNVAYHVTDCPSFVSFDEEGQPENYCIFDPTCFFAPGATKKNPGRRWEVFKQPSFVTDFPEQFAPYLLNDLAPLSECAPNCLQNVTEKGYVVFRLPLTRQYRTSLGSAHSLRRHGLKVPKQFTSGTVHDLLMELKDLASDTLLFLHHVKKMSAFEISEDGKYCLCFSTQNSVSPQDAEICHKFSEKIRNVTLNEQIDFTATYKPKISHVVTVSTQEGGFVKETSEWLVHQRYCTKGIDHELLQDANRCSFRPLGGIAAPIGQIERHHLVFCFLPMPLRSGYPIHINGHFLVDDSRKHLENAPNLRLDKWNKSLAENVIAPCYVDLLLHAQQMTERCETEHEWFYSLFPQMDVEGEVGGLKLAEAVYKKLLSINPRILLQIQHSPWDTEITKVWFRLRGNETGYFFYSYTSEDTKKVLSADDELEVALIDLGMPITTEAPIRLLRGLARVDQTYIKLARVDPHKIVNHLRQVDISKLQATLTNKTALQLLLEFCIEGMKMDDLLNVIKTVPLLLSADGCLKKGPTIYDSKHSSLLPHCSAHFIDKELELSSVGQVLSREDYHVIIPLQVDFVAQHIVLGDTTEAIEISKISANNLSLVAGLWEYLATIEDELKCLQHKPLIPTEDNQLFPLLLANAVLCNKGGNVHIRSVLKKLGYSTLSPKGLNLKMQRIFSGVVNKCSDGSDIIKCFRARPPSKYEAILSREEVRVIIESVRTYQPWKVASILGKLQLFETLDGTFTAVDGKCNIYVTSMPHKMPQVGMKELQAETGYIILKMHDDFLENFYKEVLPHSSVYVNLPELYREFIIPNMSKFNTEALHQHLGYIRDMRYHMRDKNLMLKLKESPFINVQGRLCMPSEMYDPDSDFIPFLECFCEDRLLPIAWSEKEWVPFLRELGLRQEICLDEWLKHAKQFVQGVQQGSPHTRQSKSNALLKALSIVIQNQEGFNETLKEFLVEVSEIEFIYNPSIQTLEVLVSAIFRLYKPKENQRLFCFKGSVMSGESELAALCKNVLPEMCNETLQKCADIRNALKIECPVKASTVIKNLKILSARYTFLQNFSTSREIVDGTNAVQKLTQIMSAHYAALDKTNNLRVQIDTESLRNTLCIAAGSVRSQGSFVLIKPSQLVMSIPPDIHLEPFCYPVPNNVRPYSNFLAALDVPDELSARKCVEILAVIYKQLKQSEVKLSEFDEYKRVALSAYEHLVFTQKRHEEELPDVLYLPSEDDDIYPNGFLLHNNAKWYSQRLKGENFHFLKLPPPDANGERDPPPSLGVRMLTDVVSEKLHVDMWSRDCACTDEELHARNRNRKRCHYVLKIHNTLVSPHLQNGLLRVYFDEHKVKPPPEFEAAVEMLQHVKIKCVMSKTIVTQLHKDGSVIKGTEYHKYCHVSLQGDKPQIWIAPHGPFVPSELLQSLSGGVKMLLHNQIKNEAHLMAMFDCEPNEIEQILDQKQVAFYDPNTIKETKYHEIGETVPLESITPNDCLIILNYEIGEKVMYQDSSGSFVLAEVTQVNHTELNCLQKTTITLRIRSLNSDPEEQESDSYVSVSPLHVYKILTPSQKMFLFRYQSLPSPEFTLATAAPICLAEVPSTENDLHKWLDDICQSLPIAELPEAVISMIFKRLEIHLHYVLRQEETNHQLLCSAVQYLQELNPYTEISREDSGSPIPEDTTDSEVQTPTVFPDLSGSQPITLGSFTATLPQPQQSSTASSTSAYLGAPSAPLLQQAQAAVSSRPQYQPRLQPQQRRGYQPPRRSRFQPQVAYEQPQAPPPPPVSEKDAQVWFDQAKADYRAADFLMGQITLSPMVVATPTECINDSSEDEEEESSEDTTEAPSTYTHSMEVEDGGPEERPVEEEYGSIPVPSEVVTWSEEGSEIEGEVEVRSKVDSGSGQSVPQFPALVCFLCHETVEKCIKGVLYAYCGLKPSLINSSALVSLLEALRVSGHCPSHLIKPIEECVMQINEHENKSRLPNYQTPPCAPATVYTAFNANETFLATRSLLQHLQGETYLATLLGDLGELPKPKFTSSLKAMAGGDTGTAYMYSIHK